MFESLLREAFEGTGQIFGAQRRWKVGYFDDMCEIRFFHLHVINCPLRIVVRRTFYLHVRLELATNLHARMGSLSSRGRKPIRVAYFFHEFVTRRMFVVIECLFPIFSVVVFFFAVIFDHRW